MRIFTTTLAILLASQLHASQGEEMNSYQQGIYQRRVAEAHELWATMKVNGFTENTKAALDFVFFSNSENEALELMKSLSENYTLELSTAHEPGYFLIKGTTRPYGYEFTQEQWLGWVGLSTWFQPASHITQFFQHGQSMIQRRKALGHPNRLKLSNTSYSTANK